MRRRLHRDRAVFGYYMIEGYAYPAVDLRLEAGALVFDVEIPGPLVLPVTDGEELRGRDGELVMVTHELARAEPRVVHAGDTLALTVSCRLEDSRTG